MIINFGVLGGGGGGEYHLPTATASRLGGVKIGSGVTVTADGTISVEGGSSGDVLVPVSELPETAETGEVRALYFETSASTGGGDNYWETLPDYEFLCHLGIPVDPSYNSYENSLLIGTIHCPDTYAGGDSDWDISVYWVGDDPACFLQSNNGSGIPFQGEFSVNIEGPQEGDSVAVTVGVTKSGDEWQVNVLVDTNGYSWAEAIVIADGISEHVDPTIITYDNVRICQFDGAQWVQTQSVFSAETNDDRNMLAVKEGDVCVVAPYAEEMPERYYEYLGYGWDLGNVLYNTFNNEQTMSRTLKYTLIENPYWDEQSEDDQNAYIEWAVDQYTSNYGIHCDSTNGWSYCAGVDDPSDLNEMSVGDSFVCNMTDYGIYSLSNDNYLFEHSGNTAYRYVIRVEEYVPQTSYLYINGTWIKPASSDDVVSAMTRANEAYNYASSRLSHQDRSYTKGEDPVAQMRYTEDCVCKMTEYDNGQPTDKGLLIHQYNTTDEASNKWVRELVSSKTVLKLVSITQEDYDDLVDGGTTDPTTLYVIIPDNS